MFCKNCGKKSDDNQKFCTYCGEDLSVKDKEEKPKVKKTTNNSTKNSWGASRVIPIIIFIVIVGFSIYGSLDEDSIATNNEGLSSFNSGDNETAINYFQQASQGAVTNDLKIRTLVNLAYVHDSNGSYDDAYKAYQEALLLSDNGSFYYYLISGEMALLEGKPSVALSNYNKAYNKNPDDSEINNALALFYLDIEDLYPQYVDYSKALSYAKRAYELDVEKTSSSIQNLALAYYFNNNYSQTISLLSNTDFTQFPFMAVWLGLAYIGNNDEVRGRLYLQRAVDEGADVPQEVYDYLYSY